MMREIGSRDSIRATWTSDKHRRTVAVVGGSLTARELEAPGARNAALYEIVEALRWVLVTVQVALMHDDFAVPAASRSSWALIITRKRRTISAL